MRAFALRNGGLWTLVAATAWATACGSSNGHDSARGGGARAGSAGASNAGKSALSGGSGGSAGSSTGGSSGNGAAGTATAAGGSAADAGAGGEAFAGESGDGTAGAGDAGGADNGAGGTSGNAGEGGAGGDDTSGYVYADKLDLLFVVDNSISMFEKQTLLSAAIPKLVQRLVAPWCTDGSSPAIPAEEDHACPSGLHLEMRPVIDMHVGVITTSLGAHGSHDVCSAEQNVQNGTSPSDYDDKGQLLPLARPTANLPSWNESGFLNWDPNGRSTPFGQSLVEDFIADVRTVIESTNAIGCGYESTLEATYRFLIDPEPPKVIDNDGTRTTVSTDPSNIDTDVLSQRAAFLRPDSAVIVISLSDEDDCSINDTAGSQGWLTGYKGGVGSTSVTTMPRASAACSADPNAHCCAPCGVLPSDCPADPSCSTPKLAITEDSINLRCFDQKRRFGVDLLYPLDRYVAGLSAPTVPRRSGGTAPNPLFEDGRDPRLVIFTPIVGVPWQDLAKDPADEDKLELLTTAELRTLRRWPALVGDVAAGEPPTDPFMVPSVDPRTPNANPFTGDSIVDAASQDPQATINGHEQQPTTARNDLQFACIFPLGTPLNCGTEILECDCTPSQQAYNRPLCQAPSGGPSTTTQYFGKAYPGIRHLEVARQLGDQAVVASICARNTTSSAREDYGYVPAMRALQLRLSELLGPP